MVDSKGDDDILGDDYCLMDEAMKTPLQSTERHHSILMDNPVVRKGLITLNELNEKFMKSNSYFIFLGAFLYVTIGVAVYHHWMEWDQLDSLYFVISTCSTVGFGDFVPETPNERLFTSFFIIVGIAMCGMLVSVIFTFLWEHQERMSKQRSMRAFLVMKEQKNLPAPSHNYSMNGRYGHSIDSYQSNTTDTTKGEGGVVKFKRNRSFFDYAYSFRPSMERVEKTFEEIREESISSYKEDLIKLRWQTVGDFVGIFLMLIFGMVVMMGIESWGAIDSFYWATISVTTVGYGDIVPTSRGGIVFTMFYVVFGCGFLAKALTDFVKYPLLARVLKNEIQIVNQFAGDLSPEKLEAIFHSDFYKLIPDLKRNEHELSKCEFVLMVLQLMNKVEEKDILLVAKLFENLDTDRKGFLSDEEMKVQLTAARESMHQRESLGKRPESLDSEGIAAAGAASHMWKRNDSSQSPGVSNQRKKPSTGVSTTTETAKSSLKKSSSSNIPLNDPTVNALLRATGGRTSLGRTSSTGGGGVPSSTERIFNDEDSGSVGSSRSGGRSGGGAGGATEDDQF